MTEADQPVTQYLTATAHGAVRVTLNGDHIWHYTLTAAGRSPEHIDLPRADSDGRGGLDRAQMQTVAGKMLHRLAGEALEVAAAADVEAQLRQAHATLEDRSNALAQYQAACGQHQAAAFQAKAECDAMRPVVEAAKAWVAAVRSAKEDDDWADNLYLSLGAALAAAVDQTAPVVATAPHNPAAVRDRCRTWIDTYQRGIGAGEYAEAGRIILNLLDGTIWCETTRCPGHLADTDGRPCLADRTTLPVWGASAGGSQAEWSQP